MAFHPLISVLIASYNHQDFIEETLQSIWDQSYQNIEIIVVDDCSSDHSWELLQKLQQKSPVPMNISKNTVNGGPASTFNSALDMANGELVTFVASDDLFSESRFIGSLAEFSKNDNLQVVFANGRVYCDGVLGDLIHKDKAIALIGKGPEIISHHLYTNSSPLFIQAALFRKNVLLEIGGFSPHMLADDWLLCARLFSSFVSSTQYSYIPDEVVYYRQHDNNIHRDTQRQERLKIEFVEKCTPEELKPEGFSNIYYWIAQQRMKRGDLAEAWLYYRKSQKNKFHLKRLKFLLSWYGRRLRTK